MIKRNKGIIVYLLIAFGIAWALWEVPIRLGISLTNPLFQYIALPGAFAPAVAALIVRKWVTKEGFKDAGLNPRLAKGWKYYLVAWLLPLVGSAIILGLAVGLGIAKPDFTMQRAIGVLAPGTVVPPMPAFIWALIPFSLLMTSLFSTFVLWGEEFGWRGYLQIKLLGSRPLLAAVVTGLIWGVWHYPINLRGYNFPEHPILGLLVFPVSTVMLSIIFGWLRQRTGSVWAPCLAHAATNSVGASLTVVLFMGGGDLLFTSYLGLLGWIPLGALCLWIIFSGQLKPPKGQFSLCEDGPYNQVPKVT
jgi:membrane protease YdiL (CAAX protease family)